MTNKTVFFSCTFLQTFFNTGNLDEAIKQHGISKISANAYKSSDWQLLRTINKKQLLSGHLKKINNSIDKNNFFEKLSKQ